MRAGRAEAGTVENRFVQRGHHLRVGVAQNQRPPGEDVIDVAVAVHIVHIRALALADEEGLAAHRAEGPHRRVDTAGQQALGFGKKFDGLGNVGHKVNLLW